MPTRTGQSLAQTLMHPQCRLLLVLGLGGTLSRWRVMLRWMMMMELSTCRVGVIVTQPAFGNNRQTHATPPASDGRRRIHRAVQQSNS